MASNEQGTQNTPPELIKAHLEKGDPTGWFEVVYANAQAGKGAIPWEYRAPNPRLVEWAARAALDGAGKRALVVGCGTGEDAEYLAMLGFAVTAFDIAPTAIALATQRAQHGVVDYQVVDLFKAPMEWRGAFDFVLESRTIQALPWHLTDAAIAAIAGMVAPNGTLLVLCMGREPHEDKRGIPWPLSRAELAGFAAHGLTETQFETFDEIENRTERRRFRVMYQRA